MKRVGRPGSMLSGLPSGTKPPSVTSAITADLRFAQRRGRFAAGKFRRRDLGVKCIAAQFGQQHVDGALRRRLGGELVALDAARQIAFVFRFADRLAARQFHSERGHALQRRHHARDGRAGVDDIDIFSIQARRRRCLRPCPQRQRCRAAAAPLGRSRRRRCRSGRSRTPGRRCSRSGLYSAIRRINSVDRLLLVLGEIVVAAKYRRDDFAVLAERLLQRAAGADQTVFDLRADVALCLRRRSGRRTDSGNERRESFCSYR